MLVRASLRFEPQRSCFSRQLHNVRLLAGLLGVSSLQIDLTHTICVLPLPPNPPPLPPFGMMLHLGAHGALHQALLFAHDGRVDAAVSCLAHARHTCLTTHARLTNWPRETAGALWALSSVLGNGRVTRQPY